MNRLAVQFQKLQENGEKAFVPYIMAGDGGVESLAERIKFLEKCGATAVEVGIPFSDPVADGNVIQQAGIRALRNGTTLKQVLEQIQVVRNEIKIPIVIMTYLNPIFAYGIERFVKDSVAAGIDGCIVPDLPIEEEGLIEPLLTDAGIELIRLVTLTTPFERIKEIAGRGNGFLYAVTVKGITGGRSSFQTQVGEFLSKVKEISPIPVLAGFGISNGEQAREIAAFCDGVIVGSRIVELFEGNNIEEIETLVSCFKREKSAIE